MRLRGAVAMALLVLPACQDCNPNFTETRAAPDVSPTTLDLGPVDVAQQSVGHFTITNSGDRQFDELEFSLTEDSDPAFSLGRLPTSVPASAAVNVEVRVRPEVATQLSATVKVRGRVAPETAPPSHADFTVQVNATGVNNGLPSLVVDPPEVAFGLVGLGDVARRNLTLRNAGIQDLLLDDVRLVAGASTSFGCTSCPLPAETILHPGDTVSLDLVFHPIVLADDRAEIHIASNDPNHREVTVPLTGGGLEVPTAVVDVLDDTSQLEPMTVVRLAGSRSSTPRGYLATFEWSLSYRPPGSTTVLESLGTDGARGADLAVACPDPATSNSGCSTRVDVLADLAGTYEVTLVVVTNEGSRSAPATARFRAIPKEQLHVQLVWDHPTADLDLHFLRGAGPSFNHDTDCYFSNRFPQWFGDSAQDVRNPRLDVDDQSGFGPENTNVVAPAPGRYTVAVHYWSAKTTGDPTTLATVRVYVRGQLALEQGQFFTSDQQMWNVAEIDWPTDPEAAPTLNPLGTVQAYPRPF